MNMISTDDHHELVLVFKLYYSPYEEKIPLRGYNMDETSGREAQV